MKYCAVARCYEVVQFYDTHHTRYCYEHGKIEEVRLCTTCNIYSIFRRNNVQCYSCSTKHVASSTTILLFLDQLSKPMQTSHINGTKSTHRY